VKLFKRFPNFHPVEQDEQHLIKPAVRSNYPTFAEDFTTLDEKLMHLFRKFDNEAIRRQNWYRWVYVILIFGSALTTILGIVQIALINNPWIGYAVTLVALALSAATTLSLRFNAQKRYLNARLAAERLRSEYFLFLGRFDPYQKDHDRVQRLVQRVAEIAKAKGERDVSA